MEVVVTLGGSQLHIRILILSDPFHSPCILPVGFWGQGTRGVCGGCNWWVSAVVTKPLILLRSQLYSQLYSQRCALRTRAKSPECCERGSATGQWELQVGCSTILCWIVKADTPYMKERFLYVKKKNTPELIILFLFLCVNKLAQLYSKLCYIHVLPGMNENSSRSHSIFILNLEQRVRSSGE